ncbi:MAG: hypothetical protein V1706_15075 [Pseudomonadota bacterium]
MVMQKSKSEWKGILAQPPEMPASVQWEIVESLLNGNPCYADIIEENWISEVYAERINALFKHYGLKGRLEKKYPLLIIALANDLKIPGFVKPKKRGVATKWQNFQGAALVVEVDRLIAESRSLKEAAKELAQEEPWCSFIRTNESQSLPGETVERYYKKFKNTLRVKFLQNRYQDYFKENNINEWHQFIKEIIKIDEND